jgi:hypothetical protein
MGEHPKMKVSIFIDGNNFYHGLRYLYGKDKSLKFFNFKEFCRMLSGNDEIVSLRYYNAKLDKLKNNNKFKSQENFFNNLKKIPRLTLILCKLLKRKIKGTKQYYYVLKEDDIHIIILLCSFYFSL